MLVLAGEGKAGPTWKPTSLVDVAIQGKINTFASVGLHLTHHTPIHIYIILEVHQLCLKSQLKNIEQLEAAGDPARYLLLAPP